MILEEISKFIVNLKYEDIDNESLKKAKLCFLDFLGVSYRGSYEESSQIAIKTIQELFNAQALATAMANNYLSPLNASFLNGIFAHSLDFDDGHKIAKVHPGALVFPVALSVSQMKNLNGKEFLEAVICGYQTGIIIGKIANPQHRNQGFHSSGTVGTFASGATAAKLLNLNLKDTINSLSLCGTLGSGLLESDHKGTMGKHLHIGNACYNGLLSAFLSKNGFTGAESIIDGNEGFLNAMTSISPKEIDLNTYIKNELGVSHIKDVYLKKYPFCRHLHSAIDSTLTIKSTHDFNIEDIEKITIESYKISIEHDNFNPKSIEDLKQSMPFAVAISLILKDFNIEKLKSIFKDKEIFLKIKKLSDKIELIYSPKLDKLLPDKRASKVIINLKNNKIFQDTTYSCKGGKVNPLSKKDILNKFKLLNPKFNYEHLKQIDKIESINMNDFMKEFST
jgi:2-methylcitrate dehydratase PrpD